MNENNNFKKEIEKYLNKSFNEKSPQYQTLLNLELNKIKQQQKIQIPFIKRYINKNNIKSMKILDIGCGTGGATVAWALEGAKVYGIDLSEEDLKIAKLRAKYSNVKITLIKHTIETLPYKDNYFDLIICDQVLEHTNQIPKILEEISRVSKKDSIIYIDIPNKYFIKDNHYSLYFTHWFKPKIHKTLLETFNRKYFDYPVYFYSHFTLKKYILNKKLKILGDTTSYLKQSKNNSLKYKIAKILIKMKIPYYIFSPSIQFILKNKKD